MQNVAGMRIDMDAANQYVDQNSDDELKTPIKPSEKALGKRRAMVQQAPDEEELGSFSFAYSLISLFLDIIHRYLLTFFFYREERRS